MLEGETSGEKVDRVVVGDLGVGTSLEPKKKRVFLADPTAHKNLVSVPCVEATNLDEVYARGDVRLIRDVLREFKELIVAYFFFS